ncbi:MULTISPECIES: PAS domain S-box protein [Bradyrhizobium]|uniref:PAS domain S-box protein n=1 Tax=Bradyrhizobium TaxID=374 RepID=UPI001EDB8529|nr:PAS domain S-box protein [Bradyrhizobium zhengyangense]MCG2645674.1 PAS domain S-box protein [Bradyrhizobium zhengyangense]
MSSGVERPISAIKAKPYRSETNEPGPAVLSAILAGSPDPIWCWRIDGIITQWNPAAERLLGFEASEIVGHSLLDLVTQADRSVAENIIDRVSAGESVGPFETVRVGKKGRALSLEITAVPLRDQNGLIVGGASFCRDTSERKSAAEFLSRTVRELGTLFHLTERLQAARTAQEVYEAALEAITEALACERASILLFDSASVMRFVAWRGISEQYRKTVEGHSPWTPETTDAVPIFVADIRDSNEPDALKKVIEGEGIRGLAFIPLLRDGHVIGKFMTYYRSPHQFSEGETRLASTIARQLSLSLDRIMTEEQLRESELRFRLMSEHAPVMIWISDSAGKCLHLNRLLRDFWGVEEAGIADFDWSSTIHPDDAAAVRVQVGTAIAQRVPIELKGRYRSASGAYRVLETVAHPRIGASGEFLGLIGVNVDVTEREEAEAERRRTQEELQATNVALRENEERLRLATANADVGFWDVDEVNQILHWPPLVKAMFGIAPDTPVSMLDFYSGLHPEDRDAVSAAYAAAADPDMRALYDVEYRTIGKEDGRIRWVAAKGRGVFDAEGRCLRVTGTAIDITARKADEAKLKELNETLERRISEVLAERKVLADIVEGTDAFVQVVDLEFRWLAINKAAANEFEKIFGVRPQAGACMLDLLTHLPAEREALRAVWARALSGEEFTEIAALGERERRHYEMKYNTLRNSKGERIGAYQFVYDVSERIREHERLARAEEQLRQGQKMEAMGQLTGGVAHDFNNLLTPIVGALDALQRRGVGGEREQRLIAGAMQSADRAKTLVQRLLAFARRQPLQARATQVGDLIHGMGELIASTSGPQVKVSVEIEQDLPAAKVDENQLEMALLNLAVNARDAMPDGGTLRITADAQHIDAKHGTDLKPGRYVRISVADSGIGMDESVKARAIEPFFSTKGIGKGTGLGLSMAHGLASQLGGALTIQSRPGLGTNIEIWLPSTDEPVAPENQQTASVPAVGALGTALLVDDEPLVRAAAADMLMDLGYAVLEAGSAEEAIRLIGGGVKPQLLITDHLMTGMNGTDLARLVRSELPGTLVLVVSGYAESEGVAPDLPRLVKPFGINDLAAKLASLSSGR